MRSTVDILDVLDEALRKRAKERKISYKEIVNQVLAAGLRCLESSAHSNTPYKVQAKECGFRTGVDITHLNRLIDEVEDEERFESE